MKIVGIDLGTTNSVVCAYSRGMANVINIDGKHFVPSVVYLSDGTVEIGTKAKSRILINPAQILSSTKRQMGTSWQKKIQGRDYTPIDAAGYILSYLKKQAESALGDTIEKVVVTVPAYFNDQQREDTKKAAEKAGLTVLRLLPEPTAAAIAYGLDKEKDQTILVFDLGGGTFDVSILEINQNNFIVKAVDGNSQLGGDDFDNEIVQYLNGWIESATGKSAAGNPNAQQKLKQAAEEAKIAVSTQKATEIYIPNILPGVDVEIENFTRSQFEKLIEPYLTEMVTKTRDVIAQANLTIDRINRIVLVGGSCKIPIVETTVASNFKQPFKAEDMDISVARGAALVCASMLTPTETGEKSLPHELIARDVISHSLGIDILERGSRKKTYFLPILKKNTHYPSKAACLGYTINEWQERVDFSVFRGESREPLENTKLGRLIFEISRENIGTGIIAVCAIFELDINGILTFTAVEMPIRQETGRDIHRLDEIAQKNENIVPYTDVEALIEKFNFKTKKTTLKVM